ncbi:Oidioi.mRNA.OKI2018_I69.chr2.g5487.t1.cds [Oikopleura dioica]|uniref:V-type proton ATPase subunit a n=1 Tax=Oikopleura dioica TaxID=34765 RepID=A0ABN7T102_OIKDI|nr:Oidioi.mRNA.OKI2018_I69.chr2.g5487.t1.cds [Oikopleura dioica]
MRQNEAAGDNMDLDVDEEGSSDEGSSLSLGSPKHENRTSFFMGQPKPSDTALEDRSPPPQLRNRSIDVNTPRRQQDAEEELETAAKCSELLYENIGHYFRLFADDQDMNARLFTSSSQIILTANGFGRDQIVEENQSEKEDDIVFEHQQTKEEQKKTIHDYDFEQMSDASVSLSKNVVDSSVGRDVPSTALLAVRCCLISSAYSCISELGELGLVQFRDLNADVSAFQRKFVPELRRCDEMERKLRYLEEELQKADIPVIDNNESPEAPLPKETLPLENDLEQLEKQMREVSQNQEQLNKNFSELTELKHVLRKT